MKKNIPFLALLICCFTGIAQQKMEITYYPDWSIYNKKYARSIIPKVQYTISKNLAGVFTLKITQDDINNTMTTAMSGLIYHKNADNQLKLINVHLYFLTQI